MSDTGCRNAILYQCPRCSVQWSGPDVSEPRVCECERVVVRGESKRLEAVGTIETDETGWDRLGPAAETLSVGFGVLYENDLRLQLEDNGVMQDFDTKDDPVPGEIHAVEETRYGPRYTVCPETDWWHPEREEDGAPEDHVWHWEIVEVTERTRASVRLEEIRQERTDESEVAD